MGSSDPSPFPLTVPLAPIVEELRFWLYSHGRLHSLDEAVHQALEKNIPQMTDWGITSGQKFLEYASGMQRWIPTENVQGKEIYWILTLFYFVLDQPSINDLQTPIDVSQIGQDPTTLSKWVVNYAKAMGSFMDTEASITEDSYNSFVNSPQYNIDEAQVPPDGFTRFNQLFAIFLKPGMRPISSPDDDRVIVYPADSTFDGSWDISPVGTVHIDTYQIQTASIKGIDWPIAALLEGSSYADKFDGGIWMHSFLNTFDYHRQHAPIRGTIVEAKVIPGLAYLNVEAEVDSDGKTILKPHRSFKRKKSGFDDELDAPDDAGYQFLQMRGCITVSSVNLSVKENQLVSKGDEVSYFEFGGSDIVLVFQASAGVEFVSKSGEHHLVGEVLANANPQ